MPWLPFFFSKLMYPWIHSACFNVFSKYIKPFFTLSRITGPWGPNRNGRFGEIWNWILNCNQIHYDLSFRIFAELNEACKLKSNISSHFLRLQWNLGIGAAPQQPSHIFQLSPLTKNCHSHCCSQSFRHPLLNNHLVWRHTCHSTSVAVSAFIAFCDFRWEDYFNFLFWAEYPKIWFYNGYFCFVRINKNHIHQKNFYWNFNLYLAVFYTFLFFQRLPDLLFSLNLSVCSFLDFKVQKFRNYSFVKMLYIPKLPNAAELPWMKFLVSTKQDD